MLNKMSKDFAKPWSKNLLSILVIIAISLTITGCGGGGGGGESSINPINPTPTSTGSVALAWNPPITNSDGSQLTDLAGYKIYYGPSSGNYTNSVDLGNISSFTIGDLTAGTWCFTTTAYDSLGNESSYSNEVCANI